MKDLFMVQAIGVIQSPYKEKFAIPRQPNLVTTIESEIYLCGAMNSIDSVRALDEFSHLWVMFYFHQTAARSWQPLVRPPRLGGNKKVGVLASRSTHRPNPIGLSLVECLSIREQAGQVSIKIKGGDFVDGTPVIDIKPYLPYADTADNASVGYAPQPSGLEKTVSFSPQSETVIAKLSTSLPNLKRSIEEVLLQDPRPGYRRGQNEDRLYGVKLYDFNIKFKFTEQCIWVAAIEAE